MKLAPGRRTALLKRLEDAGLSLRRTEQGGIGVRPKSKVTPELKQLIRDNHFDLLRDLTPVAEMSDVQKMSLGLIGRADERVPDTRKRGQQPKVVTGRGRWKR